MSSLFESIHAWDYKPYRRMGVTVDEELFYSKILTKFVEVINPSNVLEIGCGNCLFTLTLKTMLPKLNLTSLDLWNDEITTQEVRGYLRGVDHQLVQNLFPLPFRDGFFDLVYVPLYFYNVTRNLREDLSKEIHRVIKSNGFLILIDLEIVRKMRKSFLNAGFKERDYRVNQGIFFSLMEKTSS
ncbi:class I SAM-dependent methyltransferase [Metallosphaera tengchongensis]|uniref:Class I SAM-dependent methyltransferase n=1 Tax=Metallosphaera tengchongensis TaxID=1532350 RepID=A0A6N0NZ22_9CREN|nr:class I SAM-dependent methyltransferase [Metallosphaera tengchongensis]QKR00618.1 class I SAM-dependent methyltransferase [Metallosphaera tengchongensis]